MEGFLEANQVVEISLSKLANIKRTGGFSLRKTLMVSKVLGRAQETASSAQNTFLANHTSSSRGSSKLLASFTSNQNNLDSLPVNHQTMKNYSKERSPIATESHELDCVVPPQLQDQEPMELEHVNYFLDTILEDLDTKTELTLVNNPNTSVNVCDQYNSTVLNDRPISPGKRNYQQAFPFATGQSQPPSEDFKRFKAEVSPLDSLPGFCGYLSTKNLQTAPFITYMFGKGFTHPSNSTSSTFPDWPSFDSELQNQDLYSSSKNTTPAILAF